MSTVMTTWPYLDGDPGVMPPPTFTNSGPPDFDVIVNQSAATAAFNAVFSKPFLSYGILMERKCSPLDSMGTTLLNWSERRVGETWFWQGYMGNSKWSAWCNSVRNPAYTAYTAVARAEFLTWSEENRLRNEILRAEEEAELAAELEARVPYSPPVPSFFGSTWTTGNPLPATQNTGYGTIESPALLAGTPEYYAFYAPEPDDDQTLGSVYANSYYTEPSPPASYVPPPPPPDPPPVPSEAVVYRKWEERSYGWYTEVIKEVPNCYHTFTFGEATRVTAMSMASVSYTLKEMKPEDQDLIDNFPEDDYCPIMEDNMEVETLTDDKYFIGNFEILASDDEENWTTLYTGSFTTKLSRYVFLNNTRYFTYYRINILNNDSLDEEIFNKKFYGIGQLRFYSHEYAGGRGPDPVALYDFSEPDNPKIVKVNNAEVIEGTDTIEVGYDNVYNVAGIGF